MWRLDSIDADCNIEALREVLRFFQTGATQDKEVSKLFDKLINPPYGLPNGIVPLLIALVFRTEGARIAIYTGSQNQRVVETKLAAAIMDMGRSPDKYRARYNKLSNKHRIVFRAIAPELGVHFTDRLLRGEAFYTQCERIRSTLKNWISKLPEMVLSSTELSEAQRQLTKKLKGPVPPQLPVLADSLVEMFNEQDDSREELSVADATTNSFPAMVKRWREFRTAVERYVDGVRAPLRASIREITGVESTEGSETPSRLIDALQSIDDFGLPDNPIRQIADKLASASTDADPLGQIAAAVSQKTIEDLTEEDYGKAVGVLEVASALKKVRTDRKEKAEYELISPAGIKKVVITFDHGEAANHVLSLLRDIGSRFSLTTNQVTAIVLQVLSSSEDQTLDVSPFDSKPEQTREAVEKSSDAGNFAEE